MKRNSKILIFIGVLSIALLSFSPIENTVGRLFSNGNSSDPEKDKMLIELLTFVIEKGHYSPSEIDDTFSKGVYKDYLNALDPSKRFFIQTDIDEFEYYKTEIDDQIKNKDLSFFELTYSRLMQRMEESKSYYKLALESPFDYTKMESISTDHILKT